MDWLKLVRNYSSNLVAKPFKLVNRAVRQFGGAIALVMVGLSTASCRPFRTSAEMTLEDPYDYREIEEALDAGDANYFANLIDHNVSIRTQKYFLGAHGGKTLLHVALEKGQWDVAEAMVHHGMNVNIRDAKGAPPIFSIYRSGRLADEFDNKRCVALLDRVIHLGVDLNLQDKIGKTLLGQTFEFHQRHLATYLLNLNMDPWAQSDWGFTQLHWCVRAGDNVNTKRILNGISLIDIQDKTRQPFLIQAAYSGNPEILQLFLQLGESPNCREGRIDWLDDYSGRVINENDDSALHAAVSAGNEKCVEILLRAGADPNALNDKEETPLHYAAKLKACSTIALLLKYGASKTAKANNGWRPIDEVFSPSDYSEAGFSAFQEARRLLELDR